MDKSRAERLLGVLEEVSEFLEGQQDVRDGSDGPMPNKAMSLLAELRPEIDALKRSADGWIPVAERLPDDELTVQVAITNSDEPVWLGWHDESGWYSVDAVPIKVTHWQPMPEGPNG